MVKLGMGGKALYVLVRAVSVRPNMEPDVKEETAEEEKRDREEQGHYRVRESQGQAGLRTFLSSWHFKLPGVVGCGIGW